MRSTFRTRRVWRPWVRLAAFLVFTVLVVETVHSLFTIVDFTACRALTWVDGYAAPPR